MEIAEVIAAVSAVGSIAGAVTAIIFGARARHDANAAAQSAITAHAEAQRRAEEANRLQALDWTDQYFEGVRTWGEETSKAITEMMHLCYIRDDSEREKAWNSARARLSSLIDTGRWYFPNRYEKEYGTHKAPAYRGIRLPILDFIVDAYDTIPRPPEFIGHEVEGTPPGMLSILEKLESNKRHFVSEIQEVLNPRHRSDRLNEILERFRLSDQMRGDITP